MDLVGGAAVEFEIAHGRRNVGAALSHRLAGVARFQRGKLGRVLLDQQPKPRQAAAALERRHAAPWARIEGGAGGFHGAIDIGLAGGGDRREGQTVGRADDIDALAGQRVRPPCRR